MKKKLLTLFLCLAVMFSLVPFSTVSAEDAGSAIYGADGAETESVTMTKNGSVTLTAGMSGSFQWQIRVATDIWANISGETGQSITVDYAMLANLLAADGIAALRCRTSDSEGNEVFSKTVVITVTESTAAPEPTAEATAAPASESSDEAPGNDTDSFFGFMSDGGISTASLGGDDNSISDESQPEPVEYEYTVIHHTQNVTGDAYTKYKEEKREAKVDTTVPDGLENTELKETGGFYALDYDKPTVSANGNTVVDIYYNRYYFLVTLNLSGGSGAESVYARYGSELKIATPTKSGCTFLGWSLNGSTVEGLPTTVPAYNVEYTAVWEASETANVKVLIWGEQADSEEYDQLDTQTIECTTGKLLTKENFVSVLTCTQEEHTHTAECNACTHEHTVECYGLSESDKIDIDKEYFDGTYALFNWYYFETLDGGLENGYIYLLESTSTKRFFLKLNGNWYDYGWWASHHVTDTLDDHKGAQVGARVEWNSASYCKFRALCTEHTHNDRCYSCGKSVHTHTAECYKSIVNIDASKWILTGADTMTVAADGSSIINVYYDRREFTLHFREPEDAADYKEELSEYDYYGTITAKWGANIAERFGQMGKTNGSNINNWTLDSDNGWTSDKISYLEYMPAEDRIYYAYIPDTADRLVAYYSLQNADGTYDADGWSYTFVRTAFGIRYTTGTVDESDFITLDGYTVNSEKSAKVGADFQGAHFYYDRNEYSLQFIAYDGKVDTGVKLRWGVSLNDEKYINYSPKVFPDALDPDVYMFEGWYTTPECYEQSKVNFETMTMPMADLKLYAHYTTKTHKVETYLTEESMKKGDPAICTWEAIPHGTTVETPETPKNGGYTFVGWFYRASDGEEKVYTFQMPVERDMKLYAKWSSDTPVSYTVYYKTTGENGEQIPIADPTTGTALAGNTLTFIPKSGNDLYDSYRNNYYAESPSGSITLDASGENSFTFVYTKGSGVSVKYTVRYINKSTGTNVFDEKAVEDAPNYTTSAVVTADCEPINGFIADAAQKTLVIDPKGENVITFYYTRDDTHAYYLITHYTEALDGTYDVYSSEKKLGTIGETVSAEPLTLEGFTYRTEWSKSAILDAEGTELKFKYKRNSYPYEICYIDAETNNNEIHERVKGTALYGATITGELVAIDGYAAPKSAGSIQIRAEDTIRRNVLTIAYTKDEARTASLAITVKGAEEEDQAFLFTVKTANETVQTVVCGNGSVTLTGLTPGQCTVTETTPWSWQYTPAQAEQIVTLSNNGTAKISFNHYRTDKWLTDNAYCG